MTGPEHYLEAERLIGLAAEFNTPSLATEARQIAQVHASLALAAATAMAADSNDGMHQLDFEAWDEVCGVRPGTGSDG